MACKRVELEEGEFAELIRRSVDGKRVHVAFGTGGVALEYDDEAPLPWAVRELAAIRGETVRNTNGDGI